MRYALLLELVAAISGAWILVNTVGFVKGQLRLVDVQYGWVMAAFGVGATLAAVVTGLFEKRLKRTTFVLVGAIITSLAILPTNLLNLAPLMVLWFVAGAGQNWVNLPTQTLIADRTPEAFQGRVYGAHFAWSHLWWAFAYPLAGYLGSSYPGRSFMYGGLIALTLLVIIFVSATPQTTADNLIH
jgi:NRE family putative nickel resistance protein-like MFS transporter